MLTFELLCLMTRRRANLLAVLILHATYCLMLAITIWLPMESLIELAYMEIWFPASVLK